MIGRLLDGDSMGDEELPQFPARPLKALDDTTTDEAYSRKVAPPAKGTHGLSLLTGLAGFLIGILASHLLSKRSARGHHRDSTASSEDSALFRTTEATPLYHGNA